MSKKFLDQNGLEYFASKLNDYPTNEILGAVINATQDALDEKIDKTAVASNSSLGLIKLNSNEGISINENNQLTVDGRLGQMTATTGLYAPSKINPTAVGNGSFLVTEASGTSLGEKSLSVTTGFNLSLSSTHVAGSTQYTVSNNYVNRILCTIALEGRACLNESSSDNTVSIVSIKVGSATVSPSSTDSSTNIVITTNSSANPSSTTSSIRIYPKQKGFSNLLFGVAGSKESFGYSVIGGQNVYNGSNASAVFGNTQYNTGNSSLLAGR